MEYIFLRIFATYIGLHLKKSKRIQITRIEELLFVPLSLFNWQSMTLKDAIKSSLTILKQVMEEKLNATNIEVRSSFLTQFDFNMARSV